MDCRRLLGRSQLKSMPSCGFARLPSSLLSNRTSLSTRRLFFQQNFTQIAPFSSTGARNARKQDKRIKTDPRITLIRYHLYHPKVPRPLRFSRTRGLRHWTIHRAWQLYRAKQRAAQQLELERQYNCMREACEALRLIGDNGMPDGPNVGRLYRAAMGKQGVWQGIPIEYARCQTDYPSRDGWNHDWKR